ncbi:MAG: 2OG-Fe(II) oxygenase [Flavobacterium sp.]|nr:2OG-Fe(II) oxygenase [Candidatus Neoflavobacterium equi]
MSEFIIDPFFEQIVDSLAEQKYAIADHFFTPQEVQDLRQLMLDKQANANFKKAAIGNNNGQHIAAEVRGDFILWIDEHSDHPLEQLYFAKVDALVKYINRTLYLGIKEGEFHYAIYPEGTFYKKHLDVFKTDNRRTLSVVFYLNSEDWKEEYGGQLAIYKPDGSQLKVTPTAGRLIIFDSKTVEHEVLPVNKTRFSITGWLKS